MRYIGDFATGATVYVPFNSRTAAGAPVTLAGTPACAVYKNGSTTQDSDGVSLTVDFDSVTGSHLVTIDTSADPTFYASGEFRVQMTAGTADGVSVAGAIVGLFSVGRGVDVVRISGDQDAANNLETMLDGTGGATLSLGKLVVNNGAGSGTAVVITGGEDGGGVQITAGGGVGSPALDLASTGNASAISATGSGTGAGIAAVGGNNGDGARLMAGGGNNDGLTLMATGTGLDLNADNLGDGATAEEVWGYPSRTLTQTADSLADAATGAVISRKRGDRWEISLTNVGALTDRTKLWFTVKRSHGQSDDDALIQWVETTGLTRLNGATTTAGYGSLTVDDAPTGDITLVLEAVASAALEPGQSYKYDVQALFADGPTTLTEGTFKITADVTRATS